MKLPASYIVSSPLGFQNFEFAPSGEMTGLVTEDHKLLFTDPAFRTLHYIFGFVYLKFRQVVVKFVNFTKCNGFLFSHNRFS